MYSLSKPWDPVQLLCGSLNYLAIAPQTLPCCYTVEMKQPWKEQGVIIVPCPAGEHTAHPCSLRAAAQRKQLARMMSVHYPQLWYSPLALSAPHHGWCRHKPMEVTVCRAELSLNNNRIFWKTRKKPKQTKQQTQNKTKTPTKPKPNTHRQRQRPLILVTASILTFLVIEAFP